MQDFPFYGVGHAVGAAFLFVCTSCLTYIMFRKYYESERDGKPFNCELHVYCKRYPTISLFAIGEIILGTSFVTAFFIWTNPFTVRFNNGGFENCCEHIGHFSWMSMFALDGFMALLMKNTNIPWPKDLQNVTFSLMYFILAVSGFDHTLHPGTEPVAKITHILIAVTEMGIALFVALEIRYPHSVIVSFMRHLFFFLTSTFNIQSGIMLTTYPYDAPLSSKFNADDSTNVTFSIVSFTMHLYWLAVLMVVAYSLLATRWRKQDRLLWRHRDSGVDNDSFSIAEREGCHGCKPTSAMKPLLCR